MPRKFGITVTAKMKHAALWEAANKLGSQSALGRALGVTSTEVGRWINLKECPPATEEESEKRRWNKEKYLHVERKLYELTGQLMEDLFPKELRENKSFLDADKKISNTEHIHSHLLAGYGQERFLLPSPSDKIDEIDTKELQKSIKNYCIL